MKLFFRSLSLDIQFLLLDLSMAEKAEFIYKKYFILLRNIIFGFSPGKTFVTLFGKAYYYDDKYGIAYLQSLYVDNSFLKKYIRPDAVIVDIGANIGQMNFFSRNYLRAKKVYSFEPVKATYALLKMNAHNNVFNYAITKHKKIKLFIPITSLMASVFRITERDRYEIVKGIMLDNIIKKIKIKYIDLLKIDAEGAEYEVLLTCKKSLKISNFILVETSMNRDSQGNIVEVISLLHSLVKDIELIKIGRVFIENGKYVAVDLLFKNNSAL